ncbi:CLUMA_CG017137, isoform A [Clunio marinus]|uniref:CLUMA_CG017137, isoform A n=1 Tax=Clunio marinus TaxID=568069 RepID=A0A1J1IUT9_9DIPT|nr:CLUMA_CG017137, isoform A [Clunio marinus]
MKKTACVCLFRIRAHLTTHLVFKSKHNLNKQRNLKALNRKSISFVFPNEQFPHKLPIAEAHKNHPKMLKS